jgi:hypothetical protein
LEDKSELPALGAGAKAMAIQSAAASKKSRQVRWLALSTTLAVAAVALIGVLRDPSRDAAAPFRNEDQVKGTEVTLRLLSERAGRDPTHFSAGERFKLELTCPPGLSQALRVYVVQGNQVFEPMPRDPSFRCGNLVTWPGAFALDGQEPADICVYWGSNERPAADDFQHQASCSRLAAP